MIYRLSLIPIVIVALQGAAAQDEESVPSKSVSVTLPTFTPVAIKAPFIEQFTEDWTDRWSPSSAMKEAKAGEEEVLSYVGRWMAEEPHVLKGMEGDKGLVLKDDARLHAISAPFDQTLDNKDQTLVLQYEVKMQKGLECGGAYLKLLADSSEGITAKEFSNKTPYTIMFGPDKCGSTNKVHFIFNHKNPVSGKYEEKHLASPPMAKISKLSTLYTLIVKPDQTFQIKINNEIVKNGSLLENFTPSVSPAKDIPDPEDTKPTNWADEQQIVDPDARKPDNWDEDAPYNIVDEDAEKPKGWLDDEPTMIPDPDASKPADWDEEEDGTWVAPEILNPKCAEAGGCGKWERPEKRNPAYKGIWVAPSIDNPAYKGIWSPRMIVNPDYFEDLTPSNFEPMSGIGFELWTMQGDILFDNIVVSHNEEDAAILAKDWKAKRDVEEVLDAAASPEASEAAKKKYGGEAIKFSEDPLNFVLYNVGKFVDVAKVDPVFAIKNMPEVAGGLLASLVTLFAILGSLVAIMSGSSPAKTVKPVKSAGPKNPVVLKETKITDITDKDEIPAKGEVIVSGTDTASPIEAAKKRSKRAE